MYDCLEYNLVRMIITLLLALLKDSQIVPCLHIVNHICLDMGMHLLHNIHLIIGCMSYMVGDRVF
jgi:membrane glycosyltransferase